jgi:citrate lyase alpha subunit
MRWHGNELEVNIPAASIRITHESGEPVILTNLAIVIFVSRYFKSGASADPSGNGDLLGYGVTGYGYGVDAVAVTTK